MTYVNPAPRAFEAFAARADAGPVVMLNMLRFRAEAEYPAGSGHTPCSGREAYRRYIEVAERYVQGVGGKRIWLGGAPQTLIGPAHETWDEVFLVEYPSRTAFLTMVADSGYRAITVHRTAALADSRLVALTPQT